MKDGSCISCSSHNSKAQIAEVKEQTHVEIEKQQALLDERLSREKQERQQREQAAKKAREHAETEAELLKVQLQAARAVATAQEKDALINQQLEQSRHDHFVHSHHPLAELLNTLGTLLHAYELEHYPEPQAEPADILRLLMSEHDLKQSDLPEIGSQGVVSEILNGKRQLNIRQIQRLSKKFHISAATFLP
ncbi:Antitoxin HigA [Candidatus Venteria ishoeyi]|uniref:Antitoxin HigA n=1 Tax=Candidatus Venteria ishoeyi TaxID=1899563 RepID=A0A1H6F6S7_9GAMM|nr:Antitoxin HigA [Candidatus Venteria ishoeyi]